MPDFQGSRVLVHARACALVWGSKKTRGDLVEFRGSYGVNKIPFIDPLVLPSTVGGKASQKCIILIGRLTPELIDRSKVTLQSLRSLKTRVFTILLLPAVKNTWNQTCCIWQLVASQSAIFNQLSSSIFITSCNRSLTPFFVYFWQLVGIDNFSVHHRNSCLRQQLRSTTIRLGNQNHHLVTDDCQLLHQATPTFPTYWRWQVKKFFNLLSGPIGPCLRTRG